VALAVVRGDRTIAELASEFGILEPDAARWEWRSWLTDPMAWLFWRILDALDYWLTQARLWVVDVRPEAGDGGQSAMAARFRGACANPVV
jgi:hypothetical protein